MMKLAISVLAVLTAIIPQPFLAQSASGTLSADSKDNTSAVRHPVARIRHLPVASFPQLPEKIAEELLHRECSIPQTWQAHRPENVIHASLEAPGSDDWAVLCSVGDTVSLLVFFSSQHGSAQTLAQCREEERLQPHGVRGELGFNWGIDPATPAQVHQAQAGLAHRPPPVDHDALADSHIDQTTVYRFYRDGRWIVLDTP